MYFVAIDFCYVILNENYRRDGYTFIITTIIVPSRVTKTLITGNSA